METIKIYKGSPGHVRFLEGFVAYFGSKYGIHCEAPEFREDFESEGLIEMESDTETLAICPLIPDPLRRGIRTGTLVLPKRTLATGRYWLRCELAGDTVFRTEITAYGALPEPASEEAASGWKVVDLGALTSSQVSVANMTQVRLQAEGFSAPLNITASGDIYEAYLAITGTAGRFPFTDVLINGVTPVWWRKDSLAIPSAEWVLHVTKIAGKYYAELSSGTAHGAEIDPDGKLVNSMEVNS